MIDCMEKVEKDQKIKIDEIERKLKSSDDKVKRIPSHYWKEGKPKDILQFTLRRVVTEFKTQYDLYAAYPFDRLTFESKFEMSAFTMEYKKKKIDYRFDFY